MRGNAKTFEFPNFFPVSILAISNHFCTRRKKNYVNIILLFLFIICSRLLVIVVEHVGYIQFNLINVA